MYRFYPASIICLKRSKRGSDICTCCKSILRIYRKCSGKSLSAKNNFLPAYARTPSQPCESGTRGGPEGLGKVEDVPGSNTLIQRCDSASEQNLNASVGSGGRSSISILLCVDLKQVSFIYCGECWSSECHWLHLLLVLMTGVNPDSREGAECSEAGILCCSDLTRASVCWPKTSELLLHVRVCSYKHLL